MMQEIRKFGDFNASTQYIWCCFRKGKIMKSFNEWLKGNYKEWSQVEFGYGTQLGGIGPSNAVDAVVNLKISTSKIVSDLERCLTGFEKGFFKELPEHTSELSKMLNNFKELKEKFLEMERELLKSGNKVSRHHASYATNPNPTQT
jgi:hypothetical protein